MKASSTSASKSEAGAACGTGSGSGASSTGSSGFLWPESRVSWSLGERLLSSNSPHPSEQSILEEDRLQILKLFHHVALELCILRRQEHYGRQTAGS
jgi:hypothetical protein